MSEIEPKDARALCKRLGLRATAPRLMVLSELMTDQAPRSADDIRDAARRQDPSIQLSAVYRTLRVFREAGFVRAIYNLDGQAHYVFDAGPPKVDIIDSSTGRVSRSHEARATTLAEDLAASVGLTLKSYRFEIIGRAK